MRREEKVKLYAVDTLGGAPRLVEALATEQPKQYRLDKYTLPMGRLVKKEAACLSPEAAVNEYISCVTRLAERLLAQAKQYEAHARAARALLKETPTP